jgi:hypothetical protein
MTRRLAHISFQRQMRGEHAWAGLSKLLLAVKTPKQPDNQPPNHPSYQPTDPTEFPRLLVRDAGAPAAAWVVLHSPPDSDKLLVTVAWQVTVGG